MTDREIDVLVAEKIMGCKVVLVTKEDRTKEMASNLPKGTKIDNIFSDEYYIVDKEGMHVQSFWAPGHISDKTPVWKYTKSIEYAWAVINKMQKDGYDFHLFNSGDGNCADIYKDGHLYRATGTEMPAAICAAALKAVGAID